MLLIKLVNKKNNRFTTKTPFFLFFKNKKFKYIKNLIKKRDSIFIKKQRNLNSFFTNKNKLIYHSIMSDKLSFFLEKSLTNSISQLYYKKNVINGYKFNNNNYYFSNDLKYIIDYSYIGRVFSSIKNLLNGYTIHKGSNGSYIEVVSLNTELNYSVIKLPSGYLKKIPIMSVGYLGRISGLFSNIKYIGKFRFSNKKKSNRGVARNPIDHPNGGRSNTKKPFMNCYNKLAKKGK